MTSKHKPWRDVLPVHPAAELFPPMSDTELRELGEDIKKNELQIPIVVWSSRQDADHPKRHKEAKRYSLLDGRNRLDAMELVGIPFNLSWMEKFVCWDLGTEHAAQDANIASMHHGDPYEFVISANIHRRHLTAEQKRDLIGKLLKADPTKSDRAVAKTVKADDKTVAKVRRELEGRSEIPNVKVRTDTKGRKQPAKKPAKEIAASSDDGEESHLADDGSYAVVNHTKPAVMRINGFLWRARESARAAEMDDMSGLITDEILQAARNAARAWNELCRKMGASPLSAPTTTGEFVAGELS
jgi:hypothetical protein